MVTHTDLAERGFKDSARQVAALVWRKAGPEPEILLVTSRISGHWLLPKGWPMEGKSAAESALQEAFEEAGVWGVVAAAEQAGILDRWSDARSAAPLSQAA